MPDEPYSDGFLCTFDNGQGITVGQTDILGSQPASDVIGHMLVTQPSGGDPDLYATSATVSHLTLDANGNVVTSEIVAIIWIEASSG